MSGKLLVGDISEWSGMFMDLHRQIGDGSLIKANMQAFLEHRNPFAITDIRQEWQEFYRKYFRISVDFSDVVIPEDSGGFDRVIFIPKGLTFVRVIKAFRKQFKVYLYTENLDENITENIRVADRNYAIRVRERQEADEELKNLSANQLKEQGVNAITLLERMVYELKYWLETSQHLDIQNITLCAGSRSRGSSGSVPSVDGRFGGGRISVSWVIPGGASGGLRARQVVSN